MNDTYRKLVQKFILLLAWETCNSKSSTTTSNPRDECTAPQKGPTGFLAVVMSLFVCIGRHTADPPEALSNGAIPKLNFLVSGRISVVMWTFSVFGLSYPLHTIKFIPEFDMLCLCRNSQSFHINTGGVSSFTTQNISSTGSFRTFRIGNKFDCVEGVTGAPATNFALKRVKTRYLTLFCATKNCVVICRASLLYEMGYPFRSTVFVPMEF